MELHARPELAAQYRMVDDASGDVEVGKHMQESTNTDKHSADTFQTSVVCCLSCYLPVSGVAH